ncbi:hypothetical protein IFM89_013583 [Coptis chinensis]|uniref:Uncharacterized protein n=1 Tax=Coptis chinensis TaxID=261450 RepID=A0A835LLD9_9MAGN|nr:hypothetical protein IFM89_013583 [Coptis chinensis]
MEHPVVGNMEEKNIEEDGLGIENFVDAYMGHGIETGDIEPPFVPEPDLGRSCHYLQDSLMASSGQSLGPSALQPPPSGQATPPSGEATPRSKNLPFEKSISQFGCCRAIGTTMGYRALGPIRVA